MLTNNEKFDKIIIWITAVLLVVLLGWKFYDGYQSKAIPTGKSMTATVSQGEGLNDVIFRVYNHIGVDCNIDQITWEGDIETLNEGIDIHHLHPGMQVKVPIYIPRKYIDKYKKYNKVESD